MLQDGLVAFLPGDSIGNFRFVGKPEVKVLRADVPRIGGWAIRAILTANQ
jgi:hypothetical protein